MVNDDVITWAVPGYHDRFAGVLHAFPAKHPGPCEAVKVDSLCGRIDFMVAPAFTVGVSDHRIEKEWGGHFRRCKACSKKLKARG